MTKTAAAQAFAASFTEAAAIALASDWIWHCKAEAKALAGEMTQGAAALAKGQSSSEALTSFFFRLMAIAEMKAEGAAPGGMLDHAWAAWVDFKAGK